MPNKKLTGPLLSLTASGRLGKAITIVRRLGGSVGLLRGHPSNPNTEAQVAWRSKFQQAISWWHAQSAADQLAWERLGTQNHMTGYAYFMQQALAPNPGVYLPLLGGEMQGEIDMAGYQVVALPNPTISDQAARKGYVDAVPRLTWKEGNQIALTDAARTTGLPWTDLDLTAFTSPTARKAVIDIWLIVNSWSSGVLAFQFRQKGVTDDLSHIVYANVAAIGTLQVMQQSIVGLDVNQVMQYNISVDGTANLTSRLYVAGYW